MNIRRWVDTFKSGVHAAGRFVVIVSNKQG
jgi:hypothetical protein